MKTALVIFALLGSSLVLLSNAQQNGGRSVGTTGDRSRPNGAPTPRAASGMGAMGMGSGAKPKQDETPKRCGEGQVPSCPKGSKLQRLRETQPPLCYAAGSTEGTKPICTKKSTDFTQLEPVRPSMGMGLKEETPDPTGEDDMHSRNGKGGMRASPGGRPGSGMGPGGRPGSGMGPGGRPGSGMGPGGRPGSGMGPGGRPGSGMGPGGRPMQPKRPASKTGSGSGQGPRDKLCEPGEKPSCPKGSKLQRRRGTPAPLCYTRGSEEGTVPVCKRRTSGDRSLSMAPIRLAELKGAATETQVSTGTPQTPKTKQETESERALGPAVAAESAGGRPNELVHGTESDRDGDTDDGDASGTAGVVGGVVAAVLGVAIVGAILYKLVQRRGTELGQPVADVYEQGVAMAKPVYPESHDKGREAVLSNPVYVKAQQAVGATQHVV